MDEGRVNVRPRRKERRQNDTVSSPALSADIPAPPGVTVTTPEENRLPNPTPNHTPLPPNQPLDPAVAEELRPLLRLRQLAREIDAALANNNMELVSQAASLLAPTLAHWNEKQPNLKVGAGEAAQIALDTQNLLDKCEATLQEAMQRIRERMRRLQQGKRAIAAINARRAHHLRSRRIDLIR